MVVSHTKVVQVTNIAPQATKDQMQTLFGYLGKIEDIRLYPTIRDVSCPVQSRICYVKFMDTSTVGIAQHMTNTVFIDRALIVIPVQNGDIPDEYYALEMTRNGAIVPGLNVNEPKLPAHVVNSVQGIGAEAAIATTDPQLETNGLPQYPALPVNFDSVKVEETRRTVMVSNIDPAIPTDEWIEHFTQAGEVKYLRACQNTTDNTTHILIEFSDQPSVIQALKMNGTEFKDKPLEITHATQPIVKPQAKSNEAAQKEIEEAMSRFKEAQNMINASIEPVIGMLTKDKRSSRRSRSRSRGRRRRSRSRSRSRRSRSRRRRSTSRSRKSRSRDRKKRSNSRSRKRSRSHSRRSRSRRSRSRKSRSKSPSKRRNSRHKSKETESRARSHDKDRKSRDRSKDRKRDKDRKSKDRGKSKEKSTREPKDKKSDKESSIEAGTSEKKRSRSRSRSRRRSRSKDRKVKDKRRSRSRGRKRSPSPRTSRKRSRSKSRDRRKEKKERKEKRDRDRSRSKSKVPRNYDEEEKGFDSEKSNPREPDSTNEKDSSEKSDNMDISNSP